MRPSRWPARTGVWKPLRWLLLLPPLLTGALLLLDQPGLGAEHFALVRPWQGRPVHAGVGEPRLAAASEAALLTDVVFSIRWRGWLDVRQAGRHRFTVEADDGGYLRLAGELVADTAGVFGDPRPGGRVELASGFHPIEIGLFQTGGDSRLAIDWKVVGSGAEAGAPLPAVDLYAHRPLAARRALRRAFAGWPRAWVRLLGAALFGATLWLAARWLPRRRLADACGRWAGRLSAPEATALRRVLIAALSAAAFAAVFPFTGTLRGGDDTAYLAAATFNEQHWFFNRYAHVYLLKLFTFFAGGDPLLGVRLWWSAVFAATVGALAVAARSLGRGLQLGTLAATLFVLLSQTTLFGVIGAAFADVSCMMFVTAGVAAYLHGLARDEAAGGGDPGRPPPRREWHALAVGALTVAAFRSKEVGAILLALTPLLLIAGGRLDLRRFARRMAYWAAGAAAVLAVLVLLDGWILGDFLFTFDGERLARSRVMNFPGGVVPRADDANWLAAVWNDPGHPAGRSLRYLWLGILAAAVGAGLRRRRAEILLLHLLPIGYLLALIALYVRMPHPISIRMLIPILPVGCLMAGRLLADAGLDEIPWRRLFAPAVLLPVAAATALVFVVVVPYRMGRLAAADFLPAALVERFGWTPDHFARGVLLPAVVLAAVALFALIAHRRRARLTALVVVFLAVFGLGFEFNRTALAERQAAQQGDLLLFPWRAFAAELAADPPSTVVVPPLLAWRYGMTAQTRTSIARLALGRRDLYVELSREVTPETEAAIGSLENYREWRRAVPGLEATATRAPQGLLVLVRPQAAAAGAVPEP